MSTRTPWSRTNDIIYTQFGEDKIADFVYWEDAHVAMQAVNQHAALLAAKAELVETIRWVAQTVHQGNHADQPGTFRECPKSTCNAAKQAIARAQGL